ncbi:hypothetical protein GIB67_007814 [Kingdonia uniflora]|uniref:Poly(A) RNA polymerase mitochondrial-like central palm domain-containing protein n=1 Tax=Kingdonia uniflora TaxID=39325 RepID=A0A7J7N207_9MAGN|nr:hypothetical protein GIB67_007814 [Kingdonia uniflora]
MSGFFYQEEMVTDGVGVVARIRSAKNFYNLVMVGRRHDDSPLTFELEEWTEFPEHLWRYLGLAMHDILSEIIPSEAEGAIRYDIINKFEALLGSVDSLKGAKVNLFGSFLSNLNSKKGDLDISVDLPIGLLAPCSERKHQKELLMEIWKSFVKEEGVHDLQFIPEARVPVLTCNFRNISCDVSVNNIFGQIKSKHLLWISEIDERFHDLVILVKEWAKRYNINNPKDGTLNSYSLCLLVIFHLQCEIEKYFVLPSLEVETIKLREFVGIKLQHFRVWLDQRYGCDDSHNHTGKLESRSSGRYSKYENNAYPLVIDDPLQEWDNAARAVEESQLIVLSTAFMLTHLLLQYTAPSRSSVSSAARAKLKFKLVCVSWYQSDLVESDPVTMAEGPNATDPAQVLAPHVGGPPVNPRPLNTRTRLGQLEEKMQALSEIIDQVTTLEERLDSFSDDQAHMGERLVSLEGVVEGNMATLLD